MLLSIGMMVKNEGKYLEQCLNALKPILNNIDSELIIVDTGSEDNTVEIARKFTDKVYYYKWNNNFSEVRNNVLSYCSGKWFFYVDGDEIVQDCKKIIEFFNFGEYKKNNSAAVSIRNFTDSRDYSQYITFDSIRLFSNTSEFKFVGAVHNQPIWKEPVKKIATTLDHYGYISDDKDLMERKFLRTATILKNELAKNPTDIHYRYQLSNSYSMHGDNEEALEEIRLAYNLVSKNVNKINYRFVYTNYARLLLACGKYEETITICYEGLSIVNGMSIDKIDLYYFLATANKIIGNKEETIVNYNKYLELIDKNNKGLLDVDTSIISNTVSFEKKVYKELCLIYHNKKEYTKCKEVLERIDDNKLLINIMKIVVNVYCELGEVEALYNYYKEEIVPGNLDVEEHFFYILEEKKININIDIVNSVELKFSEIVNDEYGKLNKLRILGCNKDADKEILEEIIYGFDLNNLTIYYGDILNIAIKNNISITEIVSKVGYKTINGFIEYCIKKNKNFYEDLEIYIKNNYVELDDFNQNKIFMVLLRYILLSNHICKEDYLVFFNKYVESGIRVIKSVYSEFIINNDLINECKNEEDAFLIYMLKAERARGKDDKQYLYYLKNAVKVYEYMKDGIVLIIEEFNNNIDNNDEMAQLKKALLKNIENLILVGDVEVAKTIISEYETIVGNDLDILLLKSNLIVNDLMRKIN